jgi:hypothetical protein
MEPVAAAVEVARDQGIRVDEPAVVRDLTNVLVRLDPSPFIARVPMTLGPFRGCEWVDLEVRAVAWLAERGAPVAPPTTAVDPGPHAKDGFLVTLWDAVAHEPERAEPTTAGRTLRELHTVLEELPETLPTFARLDEIDRLLPTLRPSEAASAADLEGLSEVRDLLALEALPPVRPITTATRTSITFSGLPRARSGAISRTSASGPSSTTSPASAGAANFQRTSRRWRLTDPTTRSSWRRWSAFSPYSWRRGRSGSLSGAPRRAWSRKLGAA